MAVGKNKRRPKKGAKKKLADPFTRKDWYDVKAPGVFKNSYIGKTFVNQTQGKVLASDSLKGRIFKVSLGDLNKDETRAYRIIHLLAEDIQGREVLTNFHGMTFTTDFLKSLVRKWQSTIEARVDIKTTDGYTCRIFCIGFTKRRPNQRKVTSYAYTSQVKTIRKKMIDIMNCEASTCDLRQLFQKFIAESMGSAIEQETQGVYPLQNVYIRKCKVLKRPKFDAFKLSELHSESALTQEDVGQPVASAPKTDTPGYKPEHETVGSEKKS